MPQAAAAQASFAASVSGLLASAIQALSQTVFLMLIIGAKGKFREFGINRPKPPDFIRACASLAVFFAAGLLGSGIASHTGKIDTPISLLSSTVNSGIGSVLVYLAISAVFALAIGYREELLYRIYTIGSLRENGLTPFGAMLGSTMLFTVGHAYQGIPGIISACVAGIVLAAFALRGHGLHALAWGHAAYDFFVLITRL